MNDFLRYSKEKPGSRKPAMPVCDQLPELCDKLVEDGVINVMEARILKKWLSLNRRGSDNQQIARIDQLVSHLLSEGSLEDDQREELFRWLNLSAEAGGK